MYRLASVVQSQYHYVVVFFPKKIVPQPSQKSEHDRRVIKFLSSGTPIKRAVTMRMRIGTGHITYSLCPLVGLNQ